MLVISHPMGLQTSDWGSARPSYRDPVEHGASWSGGRGWPGPPSSKEGGSGLGVLSVLALTTDKRRALRPCAWRVGAEEGRGVSMHIYIYIYLFYLFIYTYIHNVYILIICWLQATLKWDALWPRSQDSHPFPTGGMKPRRNLGPRSIGITGVSPSNMFCSSNSYEIIFVKSMMVSDNTSGLWTRKFGDIYPIYQQWQSKISPFIDYVPIKTI